MAELIYPTFSWKLFFSHFIAPDLETNEWNNTFDHFYFIQEVLYNRLGDVENIHEMVNYVIRMIESEGIDMEGEIMNYKQQKFHQMRKEFQPDHLSTIFSQMTIKKIL